MSSTTPPAAAADVGAPRPEGTPTVVPIGGDTPKHDEKNIAAIATEPCRSRLFDCNHEETIALPGSVQGWAKLNDQYVAIVLAQRSKEGVQQYALTIVRTIDRQAVQCTLPNLSAVSTVTSAHLSGKGSDPEDLFIATSTQVHLLSQLLSIVKGPKMAWGPVGQLGGASPLCADRGIPTKTIWEAPVGTAVQGFQAVDLKDDHHFLLFALLGNGTVVNSQWQVARMTPNAAGTEFDAQVFALGTEKLSPKETLQLAIDTSTPHAARLLIGSPGSNAMLACPGIDSETLGACEVKPAQLPVATKQPKGWGKPIAFYSDGGWKGKQGAAIDEHGANDGTLGALPVAIGVGAYSKRLEMVGAKLLQEKEVTEHLLVVSKGAVQMFQYGTNGPTLDPDEYIPCGNAGCAKRGIGPLSVMIDDAGGYDLAFLTEGALHFLPNRVEAPGARVMVVNDILKADWTCAYGEACRCMWSLKDASGTDRSSLIKDPNACETTVDLRATTSVLERLQHVLMPSAWAQTAPGTMEVRLDVSNDGYTTTTYGTLDDPNAVTGNTEGAVSTETSTDGTTPAVEPIVVAVGPGVGDVIAVSLLKTELAEQGISGASVIIEEIKAPAGTVQANAPKVAAAPGTQTESTPPTVVAADGKNGSGETSAADTDTGSVANDGAGRSAADGLEGPLRGPDSTATPASGGCSLIF